MPGCSLFLPVALTVLAWKALVCKEGGEGAAEGLTTPRAVLPSYLVAPPTPARCVLRWLAHSLGANKLLFDSGDQMDKAVSRVHLRRRLQKTSLALNWILTTVQILTDGTACSGGLVEIVEKSWKGVFCVSLGGQ